MYRFKVIINIHSDTVRTTYDEKIKYILMNLWVDNDSSLSTKDYSDLIEQLKELKI